AQHLASPARDDDDPTEDRLHRDDLVALADTREPAARPRRLREVRRGAKPVAARRHDQDRLLLEPRERRLRGTVAALVADDAGGGNPLAVPELEERLDGLAVAR